MPESWEERTRQMLISARAPCSCPMCGNPRRHFGRPTVQERRADEEMQLELMEIGHWLHGSACDGSTQNRRRRRVICQW